MLIGYARISTPDQSLDLQLDALKEHGCEQFYEEIASGAKTERPEIDKLLSYLRKGDTLVVWKLDRLGRSLQHLINLVSELSDKGIGFKSIKENIDTTTSTGKLIFHIFASLSEFERDLIKERTNAGLKAARARGRYGGRPFKLTIPQRKKLVKLMNDRNVGIQELMKMFGLSKTSLYRYYHMYKDEYGEKK